MMTLFMTRYFLKELSAWVVFTPIVFILPLLIGSFMGYTLPIILIITFFSSAVVFSKYQETRKSYEKMFALFPLQRHMMLHADLAFLSWISCCYNLYTLVATMSFNSLVEKQFVFVTVGQLGTIIGCSFLLIGFSLISIWLKFPTITIISLILVLNLFSTRLLSFIQQFTFQTSMLFFLGSFAVLILCYFFIRVMQKRREITW